MQRTLENNEYNRNNNSSLLYMDTAYVICTYSYRQIETPKYIYIRSYLLS